ncbi:MAG: hypothetical protein JNM56_24715 [Planctomycetia bacterium]|nr:hypothetical protein [Planctomycetia bacterium]
METSPLRKWVKAVPFIPFTVTMSNGRQVAVTSPEMIILGRRWATVAFVDDQGYDRLVVIQHAHINTIDAYDRVQSAPPPE